MQCVHVEANQKGRLIERTECCALDEHNKAVQTQSLIDALGETNTEQTSIIKWGCKFSLSIIALL